MECQLIPGIHYPMPSDLPAKMEEAKWMPQKEPGSSAAHLRAVAILERASARLERPRPSPSALKEGVKCFGISGARRRRRRFRSLDMEETLQG